MAPIFLTLLQLLVPVVVKEVKEKIAEKTGVEVKDVPAVEVLVPAIKAVTVGSAKSKSSWFALGLIVLGFLEQNQQLLSSLLPADKLGYAVAIIGALSFFLRAMTTESIVEKAEPKDSSGG